MSDTDDQIISLGSIDNSLPQPRTERKDAAENRKLIQQVAQNLFVAEGVAAVNMADIAKEAKVGKGTLYRRFANKGELCLSLLDDELCRFQDHVMAELRAMTAAQQSAVVQLDYVLEELVNFVEENLELMVEIDALRVPNVVQDINRPHFWQEMTVRGLLQQGIDAGSIRSDIDVHYLTSAILAPLDARVYRAHRFAQQYTPEQIIAGLRSLIRGIVP